MPPESGRLQWQLAQSPAWDSKRPCVAPVGDPNTRVQPRLGLQTPVCSRGLGSKRLYIAPVGDPKAGILKHLYVAPVRDPNAWACSNTTCVAQIQLPWSLVAFVQVASVGLVSSWPRLESSPKHQFCLLYTSPSPRDRQKSRMPSSA